MPVLDLWAYLLAITVLTLTPGWTRYSCCAMQPEVALPMA